MKTYILIFFVATIFNVINGCTSKDNPLISEEKEQVFYGTIIDEQGYPIENVNIHFIPILKEINSNLQKVSNPMSSTRIEFSIPQKTIVNLYVLRYGPRDTISYLIKNELLEAGSHSVNFDTYSLKLTCGIYLYVLKYDTVYIEKKMLLVINEDDLISSNPFLISDNNGKFQIPYKWFGINEQFIKSNSLDMNYITTTVTDSISLFFVKTGYYNKYENYKIDTNYTTRKTIILKRK